MHFIDSKLPSIVQGINIINSCPIKYTINIFYDAIDCNMQYKFRNIKMAVVNC